MLSSECYVDQSEQGLEQDVTCGSVDGHSAVASVVMRADRAQQFLLDRALSSMQLAQENKPHSSADLGLQRKNAWGVRLGRVEPTGAVRTDASLTGTFIYRTYGKVW